MKKKTTGVLLPALIFLVGLGVLLYPALSDLWNQRRQESLITDYVRTVAEMTADDFSAERASAMAYNAALDHSFGDAFTGDQPAPDDAYWTLLDPDGTGVMGYIEIPKISLRLPVYHGTGEDALQSGAGHLAGTSLPVGGAGTHSVISGHRGLPSALLFTDLDRLDIGDEFYLYVLDYTLAYKVDQILTVEPTDVSALMPVAGEDYVTLLTCTPYGVNTHRLLVRGHRVEYVPQSAPTVTAVQQISHSLGWQGKLALAALALIIAIAVISVIMKKAKRPANGGRHAAPDARRDTR